MVDSINNVAWPGWEVVKKIGRGSFGTVYEIQRDVYGDIEKAALKVITVPYSEDEVDYLRCTGLDDASITQTFHQQVADIAREYKLMAQMREVPNVVRCDDFRDIQHDDGLGWDIYIKMELLTPLMKCLDKVASEEQIVQMGKDICQALIACQEKNIIHRDIKPQNVFVSANDIFKLGDFGIARTIERTTHATAGIGTYSYMAPEVEKNESYSKTADIYSLGLMLYWLLNERRGPFMPLPPAVPKYGDEEKARQRRFSGEALPAPAHGSDELKRIVLKACAYDPKDRYQTAQEMWDALSALDGVIPVPFERVHTAEEKEPSSTVIDDGTVGPMWKEAQKGNDITDEVAVENATVGPMQGAAQKWNAITNEGVDEDATVGSAFVPKTAEVEEDRTVGPIFSAKQAPHSPDPESTAGPTFETKTEPPEVPAQTSSGSAKQESAPRPKKKKHGWLVAVLIVVVIAIFGTTFSVFWTSDKAKQPDDTQTTETIRATEVTHATNYIWKSNILMADPCNKAKVVEKYGDGLTDEELTHYYSQWPALGSDILRSQIISITILDSLKKAPTGSWDISAAKDGSVMAWVESNGEYYDLYIAGEGGVNGAEACEAQFAHYSNLREIRSIENFHTDEAESMNCMFWGCSSLTALDVSNFDTSAVKNMTSMFEDCKSLTSLDVSNFDTSAVESMPWMFCNCTGLIALDVSNFDTSAVENMRSMFNGCKRLTSLDVSNLDTSAVSSMAYMFYGCSSLTALDLSSFDTSAVENMYDMFYRCSSLTVLDVSSFDTSAVEDMCGMFYDCSSLTALDVSNFDTSAVETMRYMFYGCSSLTALDLSNFDASAVEDMASMFSGCSSLTALDISNFDTSAVENMRYMFYGCSSLTALDVSNFDTAAVEDMRYMFEGCTDLAVLKKGTYELTVDISGFDFSQVKKYVGFTKDANGAWTYRWSE